MKRQLEVFIGFLYIGAGLIRGSPFLCHGFPRPLATPPFLTSPILANPGRLAFEKHLINQKPSPFFRSNLFQLLFFTSHIFANPRPVSTAGPQFYSPRLLSVPTNVGIE
jgi:hypothetical protein